MIASVFLFIYLRLSLNLTFRKHSNFHIFSFIHACLSSAEKGGKSKLVPFKNSFHEETPDLIFKFAMYKAFQLRFSVSLSILKNNPHILRRICNTLHCVLCTCMYKYGKIHRKYPCGLVSDLLKFFSCQNTGSEVLQCYQ